MQSIPRISVNLLVISVKMLANLLVKLTKIGQGGPWGLGSRDGHWVHGLGCPRQLPSRNRLAWWTRPTKL